MKTAKSQAVQQFEEGMKNFAIRVHNEGFTPEEIEELMQPMISFRNMMIENDREDVEAMRLDTQEE